MMEHAWCSDIARDEAIRLAEDDAANWRRLEVGEVVQEGDQYWYAPDNAWLSTGHQGKRVSGGDIYRRRRVPLPDHRDLPAAVAQLRERVARLEQYTEHGSPLATVRLCLGCGRAVLGGPTRCARCANASTEKREAAPGSREGVSADGLRTERVTPPWQRAKWNEALAIICDGGDWGRGNNFDHGVLGALVIWADKEMDRLTAERDAAREECERLSVSQMKAAQERDRANEARGRIRSEWERRGKSLHIAYANIGALKARVRELESAAAAPAANAGGEHQEPVAWGVRRKSGTWWNTCFDRRDRMESCIQGADAEDAVVLPLYAAPQPPRGWLTEEERDAVDHAADIIEDMEDDDGSSLKRKADVLRCLLARFTPPRVKVPHLDDLEPDERPVWVSACIAWIAAIREAGLEVGE